MGSGSFALAIPEYREALNFPNTEIILNSSSPVVFRTLR